MSYLGYYDSYDILNKEHCLQQNDSILLYKLNRLDNVLNVEVYCWQANQSHDLLFKVSKSVDISDNSNLENRNIFAIKAIWLSLVALWIF